MRDQVPGRPSAQSRGLAGRPQWMTAPGSRMLSRHTADAAPFISSAHHVCHSTRLDLRNSQLIAIPSTAGRDLLVQWIGRATTVDLTDTYTSLRRRLAVLSHRQRLPLQPATSSGFTLRAVQHVATAPISGAFATNQSCRSAACAALFARHQIWRITQLPNVVQHESPHTRLIKRLPLSLDTRCVAFRRVSRAPVSESQAARLQARSSLTSYSILTFEVVSSASLMVHTQLTFAASSNSAARPGLEPGTPC